MKNKNKTQICELDVKDIVEADWNYKTEGTPEQIEKLKQSIQTDKSVGVLAVREVKGKFEVIDGNHRFQAVKELKWKKIPCENFGEIPKALAVTIARRRNEQWFEDDVFLYSDLLKEISEEMPLAELASMLPESEEEIQRLLALDKFDFDDFKEHELGDEEGFKTLLLKMPPQLAELWKIWEERCERTLDYKSNEKFLELALAEAINTPEESQA